MDTITQTEIFENTTPEKLYELLMDEAHHSEFTGADAHISNEVGGTFTAYDDYATGRNLELVVGKKIIQSWRASDWPEGVVSTITYEFEQDGDNTIIHFTQTGVPANQLGAIAKGWTEFYWEPIRDYLRS